MDKKWLLFLLSTVNTVPVGILRLSSWCFSTLFFPRGSRETPLGLIKCLLLLFFYFLSRAWKLVSQPVLSQLYTGIAWLLLSSFLGQSQFCIHNNFCACIYPLVLTACLRFRYAANIAYNQMLKVRFRTMEDDDDDDGDSMFFMGLWP